MKSKWLLVLPAIAVLSALGAPCRAQVAGQVLTDKDKAAAANEKKAGAAAADQIAKQEHLSKDKALIARVTAIGQKMAALANTTVIPATFGNDKVYKFDYTFHVVEDKDVNAFSIPGGYIYVTTGLLDFVRSDDELAAVIGHEITHAAHHHVFAEQHEANKMSSAFWLGLLAALAAHTSSADMANVAATAQIGMEGGLNHFGQKAERDADHGGLILMTKAGYNPVAMVTFMQRLEDQERRSVTVEWGILRDHPVTADRIAAAQKQVADMGIKITTPEIREATNADQFVVTRGTGGVAQISLGAHTCATLNDPDGARAQTASALLNQHLAQGLQIRQVEANANQVDVDGQPVLTVTAADAALRPGATPEAMAGEIVHSIQSALYAETFVKPPSDTAGHTPGDHPDRLSAQ